ncbi:MAG: thiamine phosphate synthase [Bacteroidota bacterium]
MIAKLQYISQGNHLEAIEKACEAGCNWIQLRVKNRSENEVLALAQQARTICTAYQSRLIINDYPDVAKAVQADGVHLGKTDQNHQTVREYLGQGFIIGGTANTFEDIKAYAQQGAVNYIGLGPFRFTTTKRQLSPVLGIEGYQKIVAQCQSENIKLPIVAIGGILLPDISAILDTGVHGIALSRLITKADNKADLVQSIKSKWK